MVVNQVNMGGITVSEAKNHPPVSRSGYRIIVCHIPCKAVKSQAWEVHILGNGGSVEQSKNLSQPFDEGLLHPLGLIFVEEYG